MKFKWLAGLCLGLGLISCAGGSKAPPLQNQDQNQDAGGLWYGTLADAYWASAGYPSLPKIEIASHSGTTGQAMSILAGNNLRMGGLYSGSYSIQGSNLTGTGTSFNANGSPATYNIAATVTTRTSVVSQSSCPCGDSGTSTVAYDTLYERPVSIASLAGISKVSQATNDNKGTIWINSISISADGSFSGSASTGAFTGSITQIDSTKNLFNVSIQFTSTGVSATGLAFWSDGVSPNFAPNALYLTWANSSWGAAAILTR